MTDREVHSAVVRWLTTVVSETVIKADQSGERPSLPYVMVNYTGSDAVRRFPSSTEYSEDTASGRILAKPVIETEWRFSIHAYAASPSDILRPVRSGATLAQINEPLMPSLVIHDVSQVRYIPEKVDEAWEPRAQMDLYVRGLVKDGHLIDTIEEFSVGVTRV